MLSVATIAFAVMATLFILDGFYSAGKNRTLVDFFLRGGKLRTLGFFSNILSTNLSVGNFLIFVAGWGFTFGIGGIFWFSVNLALNAIGFYYYLPRFKAYIEDPSTSGTVHEYLALAYSSGPDDRYAHRLRFAASLATVTCLLLAMAFEIQLGAALASALLGLPLIPIFFAFISLMAIYTAAGGFRTVVWTDAVQSAALILGAVGMLVLCRHLQTEYGITRGAAHNSLDIGIYNIIGILVVGSGWFLVGMDNWQRTSASRSARNL